MCLSKLHARVLVQIITYKAIKYRPSLQDLPTVHTYKNHQFFVHVLLCRYMKKLLIGLDAPYMLIKFSCTVSTVLYVTVSQY